MFLWGPNGGCDYPTAVRRGEVPLREQRAVEMLRRQCDPERLRYYCHTGYLPARGNVTGILYLVRRGGGATELRDGREVASWCISIGPHRSDLPPTDHAAVLKAMIEGEEPTFRRTGNRSGFAPFHEHSLRLDGRAVDGFDPYRRHLLAPDNPLAIAMLLDREERRNALIPEKARFQIAGGERPLALGGEAMGHGFARGGVAVGLGQYVQGAMAVNQLCDDTAATATANTACFNVNAQYPNPPAPWFRARPEGRRRRRANPRPRQAFPPNAVVRGVGAGLYELV